MTSGNSQTRPGPQCPCLHRDGLNPPAVLRIRGRGSRLGVSRGPRREARPGMRWSSTARESRLLSGGDGRRGGAQDAAAWVRGAGGVDTRGRRLGAAQRAEGEGARALPETGSEVLGTERGTRPHTGPLSTANSSSGKCEPGGGPGSGRGGAAEAGICGSAWPPGGAHPTVSAQGRGAAGLGPTGSPQPGSASSGRTARHPAPPLQEETNGGAGFLLQPIGVECSAGGAEVPRPVGAEPGPGVGGRSFPTSGWRRPLLRERQR